MMVIIVLNLPRLHSLPRRHTPHRSLSDIMSLGKSKALVTTWGEDGYIINKKLGQ